MTETRNPMDLSDIGPDTEMAEVARRNPNLPVALMRYHIGGCSLCGYEPEDTVRKVAEDNGVPLEVLLAAVRS